MNIGTGDYYSIDGSGYTKYANVEVIGIDPRQINSFKTHPESLHRSPDKQVQQESVIKQEDIQYDPQQARYVLQKDINQPRQIIQKSEVNSVHMSIGNKIPSANLTYSGYDKNTTPYKGILKRSMQQLDKNLSSQDDSTQYRQLCLQLDKQKKMRRELEQSYKNLLSKIHKNQRSQTELNTEESSSNQNRQFYGKTLKHKKGKRQPIQSCQQFSSVVDKNESKSEIKTVKKLQVPKSQKIQLLQSEQLQHNNDDYHERGDQQPNQDLKYSKDYINQPQEEDQNQYFIEEREFQGKVLFNLNNLSRKITDIDNFLVESEQIREKQRLNKIIQQKQKQIKRIQLQNELLKQGNQPNHSPKVQDKISINNLQNMVNNMTPTTLYVLAVLLMAVVAIAS